MKPPCLNRQITIQTNVGVEEAFAGTIVPDWEPLVYLAGSPAIGARFWAEVQDVMPSRDERATLGISIALKHTRIRMRWRNDIDSTMRVVVHGDTDQTYQIISEPAEVGGRKAYIEFMCERASS